ncbi:MAG: hypothetical protein WAL30_00655 [Candidatus Aquirickettsiella sp.]
MTEKLWLTLPLSEENKLKEVINLIASKNLTKLSINGLIGKLENNQAADWLEVLGQYNSIPSINNIAISGMLIRAKGVRDKFGQQGYPQLKNQEFEPRELLGLVILCYSNPTLIGPKLCRALNENDVEAIRYEMLANSSYVHAQSRVVPWALNLRLANYALYANDTSVSLPDEVINIVKNETIQKGLTVHIVDQRGDFDEWVNGTRNKRAIGSEDTTYATLEDAFAAMQRLELGRSDIAGNGSELTSEALASSATDNAENNAANFSYGNSLIIGSLALFQIARNTPVGAILRNIGKDLATVGSFFSKNNVELTEQPEPLSPIAKP